MTPRDIEDLATVLQRHGISSCDVSDSGLCFSVQLRLNTDATTVQTQNPATFNEVTKPDAVDRVRAQGMGHFAIRHPLHDSPPVTLGQCVQVGQPVGYLIVGALIEEILTPRAATLGRQLVEEGELLGYGDAIFELY